MLSACGKRALLVLALRPAAGAVRQVTQGRAAFEREVAKARTITRARMPAAVEITVTAVRRDGHWKITVLDTFTAG
ncbi:hypothetical protein BKA00_006102 [Actinomadura coerulea]|uniref:Uncharacterized protein n=1 Tax=Actinomadura coerulea TaxID=46159 RepID=A0A7X0G4D3_9ACTN|nr:hypothetical protein [Actinomadura coerulea]MBB6399188.1 hypothetical protein [Actinomadura coerulea]GGQ24025.1 hypothetical protein GCM10010187_45660 [Actinomadura coerulea]